MFSDNESLCGDVLCFAMKYQTIKKKSFNFRQIIPLSTLRSSQIMVDCELFEAVTEVTVITLRFLSRNIEKKVCDLF